MFTARCFHARLLLAGVLALCQPLIGAELKSPPVVGTPEMREAKIWVQTTAPASVSLAYWPRDNAAARVVTEAVATGVQNGNSAILAAGPLIPSQAYTYEVLIDGKPAKTDYATTFTAAPMFRGYTPPPDFVVAAGGGHYVNDAPFDPLNRTPGAEYEVFLSLLSQAPNLMLWTGNNLHLHEADYGSRSGILDRYTKSRSVEELAPLLASVPNVAVWGAHDFGNAGDGKFFRNRKASQEVFEAFWPNAAPATESTLATNFHYGDAEFFLLDVNSSRDSRSDIMQQRAFLGAEQIDWLVKQMKASRATFKVVVAGAPILNPAEGENSATVASTERDALLRALLAAKINGVLFVTGGNNYGELTKMVRPNAPTIYELSVGPLTNRPEQNSRALNYFREPSTMTAKRQFALLRFSGKENAREVKLEVRDSKGNELWSRVITAAEMSY